MMHPTPLPQAAAAWQLSALATLWRMGVPASAGQCRRSASAVTLELVPHVPESMPAILRAGAALTAALGVPVPIAIRQRGRMALIDVPLPRAMVRPAALESLPQAVGLRLPLGLGPDGRPVVIDLSNPSTAHGGVLGATGSGKSNAVQLLLRQLFSGAAPGLGVILIDPDGRTFPGLPCAIDPADILQALAWAAAEVDRRASNTVVTRGPVVVVVDEAQAVCKDPKNRAALETITGRGRKHRVFAILAAPAGGMLPRTITDNLRWRLAGGVADYHASMGAVGVTGAERLQLGTMILQPGAVRVAVPEVDPVDLAALAGRTEFLELGAGVPGPIPHPSPTVPEGVPADVAGWLAGCARDGGQLPGIGTIARRYRVGKARAAGWRAAFVIRDGAGVGGDLAALEVGILPHLVTVPEVAS